MTSFGQPARLRVRFLRFYLGRMLHLSDAIFPRKHQRELKLVE